MFYALAAYDAIQRRKEQDSCLRRARKEAWGENYNLEGVYEDRAEDAYFARGVALQYLLNPTDPGCRFYYTQRITTKRSNKWNRTYARA